MTAIDYTAWRFWWDIIHAALLLAFGLYTWFVNRDRVTHARISNLKETTTKRIDEVEKTTREHTDAAWRESVKAVDKARREADEHLDEHDERLAKVEAECCHLPKHDDLGRVYDRINGVDAKVGQVGEAVAALGGEMQALRHSVNLINEHLINRDRK